MSALALWHFGDTIPWLALAYAGMNGLVSAAFYLRERWLLPALALNFAGYTCLHAVLWWISGEANGLRLLVSIVLAGGALGIVYHYRHRLSISRYRLAGYAFFALWILVFTYTAIAMI